MREVQQAAGLRAVESARTHLERLVADGRLAKDPGIARGYRLPGGRHGVAVPALVPLVGRVQAGGLTAAIEEPDGHVAVTRRSKGEHLFALRVAGDSMRDAGILDGDVVIVRASTSSRDGRSLDGRSLDGQIVVALVDDEATVKTLHYTKDRRGRRRVELHPANPDFEPIVPGRGQVQILGQVVEVRREL